MAKKEVLFDLIKSMSIAEKKVYKSTDSGTSWTNISENLPNVPVNCIAYEPGSNDGIYVGTDIGVFYRNNDIGTWIPYRNGMPAVQVNELEINPGNNKIYAATFGRGLWSSSLYAPCPPLFALTDGNDPLPAGGFKFYEAAVSLESSRTLTEGVGLNITYQAGDMVTLLGSFQLFPNPADALVNLKFELKEDADVVMYLSDMNGRLLAKVLDRDFLSGTHTWSFQTSNIPAGTYLIHAISATERWVDQLSIVR
ncbi:MAG: hypothetical protein ACI959_002000 [Limisphaerales bacterium]|jgi:hypothetical protein